MNKENSNSALLALVMVCFIGLACKSILSPNSDGNSSKPDSTPAAANTTSEKNTDSSTVKTVDNPGLEKPDFTATAEELDKEFSRESATAKELEKYANRNIAVSGRVSMLVMEKKGTVQPWVTLFAPGIGHGVSCYFDDEKVGQMKMLKEDKMAKVQGFQDDFIVPKISPRLKHCVVLSAG